MARWGKETGSCTGRGFTSPGYLSFFKAFVQRACGPGGGQHGAGWFLVDDQSSALTDPYIVVSNVNFPFSNANRHMILKVTAYNSQSLNITVEGYLFWNATTHTGAGRFSDYRINTPVGAFTYKFAGGPEALVLASRDGTTIRLCCIDTQYGPDDAIILEQESTHEGTLAADTHVKTGDPNNQISNIQNITGIGPHLDANGKLYATDTGPTGTRVWNLYKDAAHTQLIGHFGPTSGTGAIGITPDNSSGIGGQVTRNTFVANATSMELDFSVNLQSGHGANITTGQTYYMFDFEDGVAKVAYGKVLGKSGDKIILDFLGPNVFTAGAQIGPYPHRFYMIGNFWTTNGEQLWGALPYSSVPGAEVPTSINTNGPRASIFANTIYNISAPDDIGYYRASEITLYENSNDGSPSGTRNRSYGNGRNFLAGSNAAMQAFTDGRTMDNGLDYFDYCHNTLLVGNEAWLIRDTEEA